MIFPKISSPSCTPQGKKRPTRSARSLTGSAKSIRQDVETLPTESVPLRYSDVYKEKKAQAEMGTIFKKKQTYPIAPDAFIPNSSCRTVFKPKEIKPMMAKAFQLRLDILNNLQNTNISVDREDDDEEWTELDDPDNTVKPTSAKISKGTLVSRTKYDDDYDDDEINNTYWTKDTVPDLFKRLQNEPWWKQEKQDRPNLRAMLLYLNEILKLKQIDSYESACYYVIEIFRTYGIDPLVVNQILDILLDNLIKNTHDQLDICTIRTIAQFMIERKDIIVRLLDYVLKCQPNDNFRLETINAVKFITDVNSTDGIDLILDHMSVVYDAPDDSFSLKMLIKSLENKQTTAVTEVADEEEVEDRTHPLLKKISEERWFSRDNSVIILDYVLDKIISKLTNATKTLIKTLTTHLIQLHRIISYSNEQFDRVADALISLLAHTDADYRLIAATTLANLGQEIKAIDLALLNSFLNDPRVLVRTECCESLKKLTGINSETILKDCADEIAYLQTLSEDNFTLQNYLREKNRVPTPPTSVSIEEPSMLPIEESPIIEQDEIELVPVPDPVETTEIMIQRVPSPQIIEPPTMDENVSPPPIHTESTHFSLTASLTSTMTAMQPPIRVEINGKSNSMPKPRIERSLTQSNKPATSPTKTPLMEQSNQKRIGLLPNNTNMWDSYSKQNEIDDRTDKDGSVFSYFPVPQGTVVDEEQGSDSVQRMIEEHRQMVGLYRMIPVRRVLVPHKISMENVLADQSHIIVNCYSPSPTRHFMNLGDLSHNQHQLNEVESVQLLSSLVIRAIQVHRQYEKFIPGSTSPSFTTALNVSQAPLYSSINFQQTNCNSSSTRLPNLPSQRPTTKQMARMQSSMQARAARDGINIHKAQNIEGVLSSLLRTNREQTKSTMISTAASHHSSSRHTDTTHAWLLVHLLKSQGVYNSENHLQQIVQSYPNFAPMLNTKIPANLVSIIWNDPVAQQIASIFGHRQEQSSMTQSLMKRSDTKPSVPTIDDEYSANGFDYSSIINREDNTKKFLPTIRGSKMHLPRHVVKFGFRELATDYSDASNSSSHDESPLKSRRRRVYMHLMMSANENMYNQRDPVKSHFQQTMKTDYPTTSYVPIVSRPPLCH